LTSTLWGDRPFFASSEEKSEIRITEIQMTKTINALMEWYCLGNWKIRILNLPFDLAQGGELVEPFRASCFGFRI
jgi:hypothetical protein